MARAGDRGKHAEPSTHRRAPSEKHPVGTDGERMVLGYGDGSHSLTGKCRNTQGDWLEEVTRLLLPARDSHTPSHQPRRHHATHLAAQQKKQWMGADRRYVSNEWVRVCQRWVSRHPMCTRLCSPPGGGRGANRCRARPLLHCPMRTAHRTYSQRVRELRLRPAEAMRRFEHHCRLVGSGVELMGEAKAAEAS